MLHRVSRGKLERVTVNTWHFHPQGPGHHLQVFLELIVARAVHPLEDLDLPWTPLKAATHVSYYGMPPQVTACKHTETVHRDGIFHCHVQARMIRPR